MLKITIPTGDVETIAYTNKTTGQPAQLRKQTGYAHVIGTDGAPSPYPDKFGFLLNKDQQPYPAGDYTLHPSALYVDRDGRLQCAPRLTPIKRAA